MAPKTSFLAFIRDSLSLTTWLLLGAWLQCVLFFMIPSRITLLPSTILLLMRVVQTCLVHFGLVRNKRLDGIPGRTKVTAQIPNADGSVPENPSDKEIVVFIIGAKSNHPLNIFAPGFNEMGSHFNKMWEEIEDNREKYGYLGRTPTLTSSELPSGNTILTISYWKSMQHLQDFAFGQTHREGWNWWYKIGQQYPHLGIMHETYAVPARCWETIYQQFQPFGMAAVEVPVRKSGKGEGLGEVQWRSPLIKAKGPMWKSMMSRMDRKSWDDL